MPNIPKTKRRKVVKVFKGLGYAPVREGAEHSVYSRAGSPDLYIPRHRDISPGVIRDLCRAAGITPAEFLDLV